MQFARKGLENKISFSETDSLYKYFPIDRIFDFFDSGLIRFTVPFVFNDPFEIMPIYVKHTWMEEPFNKNFFGLDSENPLSFFGVLSLTDSPCNQLMWSHYTNSYRGFVIEFDKNHDFFKNKFDTKGFSYCEKVIYADSPPTLNIYDNEYLIELRDKYIKKEKIDLIKYPYKIYFTKNKVWQYENEWRLLRFRDNATKIIKPNNSTISSNPLYEFENIHLFDIPFSSVKSVIFGAALSENKKFNNFIRTNEKLKHIRLFNSMISVEKYSIQFSEIK